MNKWSEAREPGATSHASAAGFTPSAVEPAWLLKAEPQVQLGALHLFTNESKSPAVSKPSCELNEGATWQLNEGATWQTHRGIDSEPLKAAPEGSSASHPAVGGLSASPSSAPPLHVR